MFTDSKWGCSSDSLRCHRKHSAIGVLLHLSRDRGGYFGGVTKSGGPLWHLLAIWVFLKGGCPNSSGPSSGPCQNVCDFVLGTWKRPAKIRAKVTPFLGSKFARLSDIFFDGPLAAKRKINPHLVIDQTPSAFAPSGVVASEALRHNRNFRARQHVKT